MAGFVYSATEEQVGFELVDATANFCGEVTYRQLPTLVPRAPPRATHPTLSVGTCAALTQDSCRQKVLARQIRAKLLSQDPG
jgi:hypothetical protein